MSNLIHSILPILARPIVSAPPDVNVGQCLALMVENNVGALVITDDNNLLGIVSERDIINGLHENGNELLSKNAQEVLWANIVVLKPTDTIETAMAVITETKRHHLLVADHGKLIAVLSIGDILFFLLKDKAQLIQYLENYIHQ